MSREAVGRRYDTALMLRARERSWAVLEDIRRRMQPGIGEDEAKTVASEVFAGHGVERLWHPPIIRIGANTTRTYRQRSDPGVRLGEDDIYFIDLGLVFDGHEGDVGATFTTGGSPHRQACAEAARTLFDEVARTWRAERLCGRALYDVAAARAQVMGWCFNHAIKGHRLGDYPHSVHKGGDLGTLEGTPSPGLWVLEIQIAHPAEPYGAFYEDLLIGPQAA